MRASKHNTLSQSSAVRVSNQILPTSLASITSPHASPERSVETRELEQNWFGASFKTPEFLKNAYRKAENSWRQVLFPGKQTVSSNPFLPADDGQVAGCDPRKLEDAYKILDIPFEERGKGEVISKQYLSFKEDLQKRIDRGKLSEPLANKMRELIRSIEIAHNTIQSSLLKT